MKTKMIEYLSNLTSTINENDIDILTVIDRSRQIDGGFKYSYHIKLDGYVIHRE